MGYNASAYLTQTNRLLVSGRELLGSLGASAGAGAKIAGLEEAARPGPAAQLGFRPVPPRGGGILDRPVEDPEDSLREILFDVQSANLLIAAGLATEGPRPIASHLSQALDQIEQTQAVATAPATGFLFAAGSSVMSANLDSAKLTFRTDAQFALDRFVTEAKEVIQSVLDQLKKLDPAKIAEALEGLGKPFHDAIEAGRLVKKGIERLQKAIQGLLDLLGSGALNQLKERASEVWDKFAKGEYTQEILARTFGVEGIGNRIDAILQNANLQIADLDGASNALRPLTDSYGGKIALIKGLLAAVALIASGLALLHVAMPWLPLLLGGAYAALIGATVLIGMNYAGQAGVLQWVAGVREIADRLAPPSPAAA
jgi:hypothetical protein